MKNLKLKFDYSENLNLLDDVFIEYNTNKFNIEMDEQYIKVIFDVNNYRTREIFKKDLLSLELKTENFNFSINKNSDVWKYFSIIVFSNEIKIPKNIIFQYA